MEDKIYRGNKKCDNPRCNKKARIVVNGGAKYCLIHYKIRAVDMYKLSPERFNKLINGENICYITKICKQGL